MSDTIPSSAAYWAAQAVRTYGEWLQRQQLDPETELRLYQKAVEMQAQSRYDELLRLLREADDPACATIADGYEDVAWRA